ncbi:hypothetical protein [Motiliproteus sp. SC1-56]|uniref:hypothetical protein n=1 Tax=Motiliproteus sp. SC1-56 TaxID=2799565 RepID=UPI001A8F52E6|nr:hypothetical protein [Motiliproteus sp. SC1-56]
MKRLTRGCAAALFSVLLGLGAPVAASAADYILVRGEQWQGVKIGGEAPRSRDSICRDGNCYPVKSQRPPATAEIARYGLRNIRFETLAQLPEVSRAAENRLRLPADLGQSIFDQARMAYWRSQRREARD